RARSPASFLLLQLPRIRWASTLGRRQYGSIPELSRQQRPSCGTVPWESLKTPCSPKARLQLPARWRIPEPSPLSEVATPQRRWLSREWNRRSHISPREAVRRWNFFPDKSCPEWKPLRIRKRSLDETADHCRELEDV